MISLAVDDRNDLTRGADGDLALSRDLAAVMQAAGHAARTLLGEMIYAADTGVPYFDVAWGGSPNAAQLAAYLRRTLLAVDDVLEVPELTTAQASGKLTYAATIRTTYGLGVLNG